MGTPTIKNRISQNQRVNRMASTRTMRISVGIMKQSFPVSIARLPVYLRRSPTETVAYGNIEGYNVHAYSHMDSISYTIPA